MPVPSTSKYVDTRKREIYRATDLRRHFRSELKKLRALPSPEVAPHWWAEDTLQVIYKAKLLNMRDSAKWLEKFLLLVPGEALSSFDSESEGSRTFHCTHEKGEYKLNLRLVVETVTQDENPLANCRRVQVGVDTHTYTSTTPRYEIRYD